MDNINSACCATHINPEQPKGQTLHNQHACSVDMQTAIDFFIDIKFLSY